MNQDHSASSAGRGETYSGAGHVGHVWTRSENEQDWKCVACAAGLSDAELRGLVAVGKYTILREARYP